MPSPAAPTEVPTRVRVGTLAGGDGLRAVAAVMVLVFHVYVGWGPVALAADPGHGFTGPVADVALRCSAGLYLFFPISGYLVGGPWVRALLGEGRRPELRRYASHRLWRILPPLVVVWAVALVAFGRQDADTAQVLSIPVLTQVFTTVPGWSPLQQAWTLDVEAMFYLALPVAFALALRGRAGAGTGRRDVLLAVLVVTAAASLAVRVGDPAELVRPGARTLLTFWFAFASGLGLAAIEVPARTWLRGRRRGTALACGSGAVACGAFAGLVLGRGDDGRVGTLVAYVLFGAGATAATLVWQWTHGRGWGPLEWRPVQALGRRSYAIYLVHIAVVTALVDHLPGGLGPDQALAYLLASTLALSVAAALVLWRWVEAPSLRRRRDHLPGGRTT